jgi:hypothetical protein
VTGLPLGCTAGLFRIRNGDRYGMETGTQWRQARNGDRHAMETGTEWRQAGRNKLPFYISFRIIDICLSIELLVQITDFHY